MSAQQTPAPEDRSLIRRIVAASMAGTVVEWYDFFLYATAAALVFNKVLMPETGNAYDAIIAAFVTYAVGFVARPLGGVIFGHLGDKLGRKHTLQLTILLIGAATVLMGCLPTFQQVGFVAPALLVVLRFVQGVALGGEWGGAVLLVAEHSRDDERARWTAWPQAGVPVGNLLATVVLYAMSGLLTDAAFLAWGWRVAFWLSAVVIVVGYYVRTRVSDAPIYEEAKAEIDEGAQGYGVLEVVRRYPRGVLTGMGLRFAENILYYLVVSFSIVYLGTALGMDTTRILGVVATAHAFHFVVILAVGRLADRVGRKPVYVTGAVLGATWCWFAFPAMDTRNSWVILGVLAAGLLFHALMYAVQPATMAEMFPTRMRYSGVSISYQVTSIVAGSLAPILATTWLKNTGSWWPTAVYMAVAALITLVAALALRETKGASLHALDAEDQARERAAAGGRA
ncbi:MFS transporter [Promicromonospora thailandica]|uniref:Arabinose efflux permease, MFS family n=1 Tax=Promicromonospora thailandica TaxID=765201 RepID=A0A9X2JT37_9MICO|nr:MFS transporter [Promicromonospora thailandica]MCP2263115.1 putative arabinose efflux permease, MFS family [Promicromonospora thailandica]BFF18493.1 MFS transporter [Promicromonospora thailandica]